MDAKREIFEFLQGNPLGVISTVDSEGRPESAVVGFGQTGDLELIFGTDNLSRKYRNLQERPEVAFVIGWGEEGVTVQYEGAVRELAGEEAERYAEMYFAKVPAARKYQNESTNRYFLVKPRWVRLSDTNPDPWRIIEFRG